ncbi:class 1 fructose-bisphosphatase [Chrysiogenes arsenatis]|uniref:class 1 fructose-bisphosphatase n=1 Tax=Chrysiogenes arsenatis TaxID=309797 RepID=UPI00041BDD98|nr:class 1 fructose-bisphosphatase [Chrysiogenes arsenatis]
MAKINLSRFNFEMQRKFPDATGDFSEIINQIALAAKIVSQEVNRAGIADILGYAGDTNSSGDSQKKLDVIANEIFINALDHIGKFCVMGSEENDEMVLLGQKHPKGRYSILFDPLDGSSNIEVNVSIGTIFSVMRRVTPLEQGDGTIDDLLQCGRKQVAAGYVLYGSSTMLVFTTGHGVNMFTLDPQIGEFILTNENVQIPNTTKYYSINEGNALNWSEPLRRYVDGLKTKNNIHGKVLSGRYIGSMVADVHRTLHYGGFFSYPQDSVNTEGKLRLLYEANPMAMVVEQAGGRAIWGGGDILDIVPKSLHQRVPVFLGAKKDIDAIEAQVFGAGG